MTQAMFETLKKRLVGASAILALLVTNLATTPARAGWAAMMLPPPDASVHGWRADWLMNVTSVFVLIMFAATCIWLVLACVLHGRKHKADYDKGNGRSQAIKAMCLSVLIFGVVDGNLFFSGMSDLNNGFWNFDIPRGHPDTVRVQVNGHQWAWDMRQPGADGHFNTDDDILSLNELRVPVDTPVHLQLAATDVIHSFSIPNFRTKQDAVPGTVSPLWFQAKRTGTFEIACAQHCGVHHYKMRGKLIVMDKKQYAAWAAEASVLATRAFDPKDKGAQWGWDWAKQDR